MSDEWITWLVRLFSRPPLPPPPAEKVDLTQIDRRLGAIEGKTDEIDVRLHLLERQSDPRGVRGHGSERE